MTTESDSAAAFTRLDSSLDRTWNAALQGADAATLAAHHRESVLAAAAIEAAAPSLDADARDRSLETCAARIERLDEHARVIFNDTRIEDAVAARTLAVLRAEARLTRRVTRSVQKLPPLDEAAFRLVELQDAENALAAATGRIQRGAAAVFDAPPPPPESECDDDAARERRALADARVELLRDQAQRRIEVARAITGVGPENAAEVFATYRALDATHRDLAARRAESFRGHAILDESLAALEAERGRIEREFFQFIERVDSPSGLDVLRRAAIALERELDESRVVGLEPATPARVARLRHLEQLAQRFLQFARAAVRRRNAPAPGEFARLAKTLRVVRSVVSDRILDLRLARAFGARTVAIWDRMIFWLIVSVLGLLAIDHYRGPDTPGEIHWTIWADTAICAILLLDFVVRTTLSPSSFSYFRRHFFTELVPALPFGLLANLEHLTAMQTVRSLRIIRTLTFLQALRPIIRIGRLFLFVSRAADRMVDQNAWLLNQNIVFFTDGSTDETAPTLVKRARELESFIGRQCQTIAAEFAAADAVVAATIRRAIVVAEAETDATASPPRVTLAGSTEPRLLDVEDVIHRLRDLDASQVAEFVGPEFAQQVTDSLRFFRLPWLRRMPVVRFILGDTGVPDPLATTARLGRVCGDLLDGAQRAVNWFADLYGTITPSQFLDRVGTQIVKATARPTRRLILFGVITFLVMGLVELTHFTFLDRIASFFIRYLSGPLIGLGVLCAIPLAFGTWFRHIARQAADFYDRIVEAQFFGLTEVLKEETRDEDLRFLGERVVYPEIRLAGGSPEMAHSLTSDFARRGVAWTEGRGMPVALEPSRFDVVLLFYRDFLDGAFFHKNDTKVANLLLGNLTLENIRQNRLSFSKRDWKRLDAIDIARGKGGIGGAAVWFHCITHSVAQNVARLILEYNRFCIPASEIDAAIPADRERYDRWLAGRERQSHALARGEAVLPTDSAPVLDDASLTYRTTEFHALHFLSANPRRDEAVRRRFGGRVLRYLREDRENLIRVVFGTFPMRDLPRERRTFNPYEFYRRYFASGRFYLAPILALWLALRGVGRLFRELVRIIREVRSPNARAAPRQSGHASFEVARRKIHRMRRPIAMEAIRLRAEFDPEYLGLALPDRPATVPPALQFGEDLRALHATEREWEQFRRLKSQRHEQLRRLARVLRLADRRGQAIFAANGDCGADQAGEAARAVAIAWLCDQDGVATQVAAHERLAELIRRVEREPPPERNGFHLPRLFAIGAPRVRQLLAAVWDQLTRGSVMTDPATVREHVAQAILGPEVAAREALESLRPRDPETGGDVYDAAASTLRAAASQPSSFTEQVLAVRAVQALAKLDLDGYVRLVEGLGGYGMRDDDLPR